MLAKAKVYDRAMGMVARCPGCDSVLMRVVRGPDRAWLDMRGLVSLEFALPMEPVPGMVGPVVVPQASGTLEDRFEADLGGIELAHDVFLHVFGPTACRAG